MLQYLNKVLYIFIVYIFTILAVHAQEKEVLKDNTKLLKLEDAILMALEHNELVTIANTNEEIADLGTHIGQAGLLPTVYLSGEQSGSVTNSTTKFSGNNPDISLPDASRLTLNATVNINYNLYNGGTKYHLNKINTNNAFLKFWEAKKEKENVVMSIVNQYLAAVKSLLLMDILNKTLELSQERLKIAELKYKHGSFDKLSYLNAEIVKNADSITLINQHLVYKNTLRHLERLTGQDLQNIKVQTNIGIQKDLNYAQLEEFVLKKNTDMKINEINSLQSHLNLRIEKAKYLPSLDLSGDYGYRDQSQTGSLVSGAETIGWNLGLNLKYTLFDGSKRRIGRKQAEMNLNNVNLKSVYDKKNIIVNFKNQYEIYSAKLLQLDLEEKNQIKAKLNYDRSLSAYETGSIQGTALREAQLAMSQTSVNIVNILIETKLAEMELFLLSGQILDN